jgi:hypothetical protein
MGYSSYDKDQEKGFIDSKFVSIFISQFLSIAWPRKLSDGAWKYPMHLLILFIPCAIHLFHYLFLAI